MKRALLFFLSLALLPLAQLTAGAGRFPRPALSPEERQYAEWLAGPFGPRPAVTPDVVKRVARSNRLSIQEEREGPETETRYRELIHPDPAGWTAEKRIEAFEFARAIGEHQPLPKQRTFASPPTEWQQSGPFGMESACNPGYFYSGRVLCFDYNASTGLYIGTAGGGLWGPPFLTPLSDNVPSLEIDGVAVRPSDPNTIFIGTSAGVYRTTDHGKHWEKMPLPGATPEYTFKLIMPPWDEQTVFVATNRGMFKTSNGGATWRVVLGIWTWDVATATNGVPMLAGVGGSAAQAGVYRSVDYGETWSKDLSPDLPSADLGRMSIAIAPSDSSRAYVQIGKSDKNLVGVYRADNARSWFGAWSNVTPGGGLEGYMWGQSHYNNAIAVHPTNPDVVWMGGGAPMHSTNGGSSWVTYPVPPIHADLHAFFYRTADNMLYTGSDGGVETTDDEGSTWSFVLNPLLPTTMFYNLDVARTDDRVKWGSSQDNATEGTTAADPAAWNVSSVADGIDATVDWSTPTTIYATTQFGDLYKTISSGTSCVCNGGGDTWCSSWPRVNGPLQKTEWSEFVVQDQVKPSWIYTNGGHNVYYSLNQGASWGAMNSSPKTGTVTYVACNSDGYTVYACADVASERLLRYHWNGSIGSPAWTETSLAFSGIPYPRPTRVVCSPTNPNRAYVIINGSSAYISSRIYRTTDEGNSWTNITGDFLTSSGIHDILESPADSNVLWIGTDFGVMKSLNGGVSWWGWSTGMPQATPVGDLEYASSVDGDYIVAGTFGRSTFERDVNAPILRLAPGSRAALGIGGLGDLLAAPSDSAYIAISTDRGGSWEAALTPAPGALRAAHIFDSLHLLAIGDLGAIVASTDGGGTWSPVNSPTQADLHDLAFATAQDGFAIGDQGAILRSTDGGGTWLPDTQIGTATLHSIVFTDALNGWVSGTEIINQTPSLVLLHTSDGGGVWLPAQVNVGPGGGCDVTFPDPLTGYVSLDNGSILKSVDGGQTWFPLQTGAGQPLHALLFTDENTGWACGDGGVFIHTTDGGTSWTPEAMDDTGDLFALFHAGDKLLVGGTGGVFSRPVNVPTTLAYGFDAGWNMVSVPLVVNDDSVADLFPSAVSNAFSYNGQYVIQPTLANGLGYWLKLPGNATLSMTGYLLPRQVIDLEPGWNLIGSLSRTVSTASAEESSPGLILSSFFAYAHGYLIANTIEPAQAYWVKAGQEGQIILRSEIPISDDSFSVAPKAAAGGERDLLSRCGTLSFRDNTGWEQTLYFSTEPLERDGLLGRFELPPPPPSGAPDARFASNQMLAAADAASSREFPIRLTGVSSPVAIRWENTASERHAVLLAGGNITNLDGRGSAEIRGGISDLRLRLTPARGLPGAFALEQNYPNPFNPATVITYQVPFPSRVTLTIDDLLGQEVRTLVEGTEEAGYKSVQWNATNDAGSPVASGIYLCRLTALSASDPSRSFSQVRKMVLLR